MLTTKIKCFYCESEGQIEIVGWTRDVNPNRLFEYLGYDDLTGNMLFRCPCCSSEVIVNPMELLGPGAINGIPLYRDAAVPSHTEAVRARAGAGRFESAASL